MAFPLASKPCKARWCKRNPVVASLTGCIGLLLIVGISVVSGLWIRAENNAKRATDFATRERAAKDLAEDRFDLALDAIEKYYTGASEDVLLKQENLKGLRENLLRTALKFYEELETKVGSRSDPSSRNALAKAYVAIGSITALVGNKEQALTAIQNAREIQEQLVADHPTVTRYAIGLGGSYCNTGDMNQDTGDPEGALKWYGKAIGMLGDVLDRDTRNTTARQFLRNSHWQRARALTELGRYNEAVSDSNKAIEMGGGVTPNTVRMQRAWRRAMARDHTRATAEADELATKTVVSGGTLYDAACVFSLSNTAAMNDETLPQKQRHELAQQYAIRAVELLTEARESGFFDKPANVEHMKKDSDLDPIREEAGFKKLMEQLGDANPTNP